MMRAVSRKAGKHAKLETGPPCILDLVDSESQDKVKAQREGTDERGWGIRPEKARCMAGTFGWTTTIQPLSCL